MAKSKCPVCNKRATFAFDVSDRQLYCKTHALDGMVDIKHRRCIDPNCSKQPGYNNSGESTAIYCKTHALDGMVDVVSKRCIDPNCSKQPVYNNSGESTAIYCKTHALDGMVDILSKRCSTCNTTTVNRKYKPNCSRCHFYLNPNDPRIRNYKTKEHAFMIPLKERYPNMVLDQIVSGGCSRRRPDGLIDCLTHSVIIEIDEDQHSGYDQMCNNRRTMELFQDLGNRPVVFIRLNPDSYKRDNKRVNGIFSVSKTDGQLKLNKKEFDRRYESLVQAIDYVIANVPDRAVESAQLFFSDD